MKRLINCIIALSIVVILFNCSERSTVVNAGSGQSPQQEEPAPKEEVPVPVSEAQASTVPKKEEPQTLPSKTDAEVVLQGVEFLLNTSSDFLRKKAIKDSINALYRDRYYAYQIGMEQEKGNAFTSYKKLTELGIKSIYLFKISRKKYCIVRFQAKSEEELNNQINEFRSEVGEVADEGIKVINLMDFCGKRETIKKTQINESDLEVKCLVCD